MKQSLIIVSCLIFILPYCSSNKQKMNTKKAIADTLPKTINSSRVISPAPPDTDTTILQSESALIEGNRYTAILKSNYILYVFKKEDTILKVPDVPGDVSFKDFDLDGNKDIIITLASNTPEDQVLLLFDKHAQIFKQVNNFSSFPASEPIHGTKYYYSYHKSGCADLNWDSDLFYIQNYNAIRIGNIAGYECEDGLTKNGIFIYQVKSKQETLIKTLPISTIHSYKEYKWGFIKDYWTKNYKTFL